LRSFSVPTGTVAVFAPVLNSDGTYSLKLWFVSGNPITLQGNAVTLPAYSFRIAVDNTHETVIVAYDDSVASLTRFTSVNAATGAVTFLKSTSTLRGGVLAVSSDGKSLYYTDLDKAVVLANQ